MKKMNSTSGNIININESKIQGFLDERIKESVEDTINGLLEAEAERICGASRYERTDARKDTLAGSYPRKLDTRVGKINLKMPKLRKLPFETAIIERYRRRETSVEEAMMEMYLAGVSVRRVEDITEALWGTRVSTGTVSNLNQKIYERIEEWRNQPITEEFPYVYLDGIWLKRSWGGEISNVSVLVAIGVCKDGFRKILGVAEGAKEDKSSWSNFLRHLKERGLKGVRLVISDKSLGLVESLGDYYPEASWQRCIVHFYRNIFSYVPQGKMKKVAAMLKAIHAQESKKEARKKALTVIQDLKDMKLSKASEILSLGIEETLSYMDFPLEHWTRIRTNNPLERLMKEIRRRTRVVGCFPDSKSALMLAAARLRHVAGTKWGHMRYLSMDLLYKQSERRAA